MVTLVACGSSETAGTECADVVGVEASRTAEGVFTFDVTVRSDDTGWDAYADRWEVVADGEVVGTRVLAHPHVDEQPFTRSQSGIAVAGTEVTVRAHHSVGGYCGSTMRVRLDG